MKIPKLTGLPLLVPARRWIRYAGAALTALVIAGSVTQIAVAQANALPDGAVYRVGDAVMDGKRFSHRTKLLEILYGVQAPTDKTKRDAYRRATAKAVAVSDILDRAKREAGVVIADKEANDQLDNLIQQSYPQGGREQFIAALGAAGISQQDVITEIKRQLGNGEMYNKITHDIPQANEADARKMYHDRKAQMVSPEQRHLRNIVVTSQDTAKQALTRIQSGEDFAAVARETSMDSGSKGKGGDLGTVASQQLEPAYGKAAFATKPGAVFGPVQTGQGWNVGQVVEVKPAVPLNFEQVKKQLINQLSAQRKLKAWNDWLQGQIRAADVRYAEDYRPADPTAPPAQAPPK